MYVLPSEIRNGILILGYPLSMSEVAFFLLHFTHLEIKFQVYASLQGCLYKQQKERDTCRR